MKNSINTDIYHKTLTILTDLAAHLDSTRISDLLDQALEKYTYKYKETKNHKEFCQEISHFVQTIYKTGLNPGLNLTIRQAKSTAIALLDSFYKGQSSSGYYAAYLDALHSNQVGIGGVRLQLFQAIKESEIKRFQNHALNSVIDPSDWRLQRDITQGILESMNEHFPELIGKGSPERFSGFYKDIIEMLLASDDLISKICLNPSIFFN